MPSDLLVKQRGFAGFVAAGMVLLLATSEACVTRIRATPDLSRSPIVVQIVPDQPWMNTGVEVHKGDLVLVTSSGQVFWSARGKEAGPDGINGYPGWLVGAGGLVGRIGGTTKTFDIGARTAPFRVRNTRVRSYYPPPALRMPESGMLELGFKEFVAGANTGSFQVTIQPAREVRESDGQQDITR